jgi:hypothetical protein
VRGSKYAAPLVLCAVATGVAYTLSPLSVVCAVSVALVIRWATSGLEGRERRWVLTTMCAALALRAIAIAVLPFLVDANRQAYTTYFGDAQYAIQRSIWIRNAALGIPVASRDYIEAFEPRFGWSGYHYLLALLQMLVGPSPYGVAAVSTTLFLTAAAGLYRACRSAFGPLAALAGLGGLVFLPTIVAWSVVPMKEEVQFFLLASAVVAALALTQSRRWPTAVLAVPAVAGAIAAIGTLRSGGLALASLGIGLGLVFWYATRRWWTLAGLALLLLIAIAVGARTNAVRSAVDDTVRTAALTHLGHVRSRGAFYRLLDDKFYGAGTTGVDAAPEMQLTFDEGARFLIRAAVAFFVQPAPWSADSLKWLALTPVQILWWLIQLLALVGAVRGLRDGAPLAFLLAGVVVSGVIVIAPNSGNIGTLLRHRDMITPFAAMLAGFGAATIGHWFATVAHPRVEWPSKVVESWR